ncbi:MAG: phosphoribosylformylglycinamidine synthase subunit PurL [Methanolobus sp.]|nr:phosphoribosylformylglycinamidine synthase subunit PurL [Methanolobus sp.]
MTKAPAGVFSNEGDTIILVGSTADELGGSEYYNIIGKKNDGKAPQVPENITTVVDTLISLAESGKITASHDVSLGGIAVALAEMCEKTGAEVDLSNVAEGLRTDDILFSESYARALITTSEPDAVMEMIGEVPCTVIGTVGGNKLSIQIRGSKTELSLEEIKEARESLMNLMME